MSGEKFARKMEQQAEVCAADDSVKQAAKVESGAANKRGTASKFLTFALLLAVPAVMTGCNSSSNCNPEYENCNTGSGGGHYGGGYYGGGSSKSSSGSYDSGSSSSSSGIYKGLGSGGSKSSGG